MRTLSLRAPSVLYSKEGMFAVGMFSVLCHGCEHPLLSPSATGSVNEWMSDCVAVRDGAVVASGMYDGYGTIGVCEYAVDDTACWHEACWDVAGRPLTGFGVSRHAEDQGWFFDDGDHDLPDPRGVRGPLRVETVACVTADKSMAFDAFVVCAGSNRPVSIHLSFKEAANVRDR